MLTYFYVSSARFTARLPGTDLKLSLPSFYVGLAILKNWGARVENNAPILHVFMSFPKMLFSLFPFLCFFHYTKPKRTKDRKCMRYLFFLIFFASSVWSMDSARDYDENHGLLRINFSPPFTRWAQTQGIAALALRFQRFEFGNAESVNSDITPIFIDFFNKKEGTEIQPDGALRWTESNEGLSLIKVLNMTSFNAFNLDIVQGDSWAIPWNFDDKENIITPLMHLYFSQKTKGLSLR